MAHSQSPPRSAAAAGPPALRPGHRPLASPAPRGELTRPLQAGPGAARVLRLRLRLLRRRRPPAAGCAARGGRPRCRGSCSGGGGGGGRRTGLHAAAAASPARGGGLRPQVGAPPRSTAPFPALREGAGAGGGAHPRLGAHAPRALPERGAGVAGAGAGRRDPARRLEEGASPEDGRRRRRPAPRRALSRPGHGRRVAKPA